MTISGRSRRSLESGFTIIESAISLAIFAVVGYALTIAVTLGNQSEREVVRVAAEGRSLREATSSLVDELRTTSDAMIAVTALADGNHQLRFMQPIEVAGVPGWGVYDRTLGSDAAAQNQPGWRVQYTVRNQVAPSGAVQRVLVRQILDDALVVRRERVLAQDVRNGNDVPPGFAVIQQGDVWEISLSTHGEVAGTTGIREVFHVHTRN